LHLDVEIKNLKIECETFFQISTNQFINSLNDKSISILTKSIDKILICSEYVSVYSKKLEKCLPIVFGQQSKPELVIKFKSGIKLLSQFKVDISWVNPNGNCYFKILNYFFIHFFVAFKRSKS